MEDIKKYFSYVIIFLSLNFLSITQVLSADCGEVSSSTTISEGCTDLEISGSNTHVTIVGGLKFSIDMTMDLTVRGSSRSGI